MIIIYVTVFVGTYVICKYLYKFVDYIVTKIYRRKRYRDFEKIWNAYEIKVEKRN